MERVSFEAWLTENTNLMERTIRLYVKTMKRFEREYDEANRSNINKFIATSFRKNRSYYVKYIFRYYLDYLGKKKMYEKLMKVKSKPRKYEGTYLKREDLEDIVNNIPDETYKIVALIQYITGARAQDVLGLSKVRMKRIDNKLKLEMIVKRGNKHTAYIPEVYADQIWNFVKMSTKNYPFLRGDGANVVKVIDNNYHYYYMILKRVVKDLGYDMKFATHDFRRNFIDDAFTNTKDIRVVKNVVGHKNLSTTLGYLDSKIKKEQTEKVIDKIRG